MRIGQWLILALFLFTSAQAQIPPQGMQFNGTQYSAYAGKDKLWDLYAVKVVGTQKTAKAYTIHGVLYHKGKVRYTLKSPVAVIDMATGNMVFPESASFESPKGERIWTHVLAWDSKVKKFLGSKGVKVVEGNTHLQGDAMVLDRNFDHVRVKGHVRSETVP